MKLVVVPLLQALRERDPALFAHSHRVAHLSWHIAEKVGISPDMMQVVWVGGLLHDIGKLGIPDYFVDKPGRLTDSEMAFMRRHPLIGENILAPLKKTLAVLSEVIRIIRHHHECYDGSGYPDRLAGDEIPIGAQIVAVAEVYDALITDWPFRKALPPSKAIEIIEGSGTHSSQIVTILNKLLPFIPQIYEKIPEIQ